MVSPFIPSCISEAQTCLIRMNEHLRDLKRGVEMAMTVAINGC